jgi:putative addiction module antidote
LFGRHGFHPALAADSSAFGCHGPHNLLFQGQGNFFRFSHHYSKGILDRMKFGALASPLWHNCGTDRYGETTDHDLTQYIISVIGSLSKAAGKYGRFACVPRVDVATIVITTRIKVLELKVRKIGNSLGVVLPKEAVSRLHAGEGDRLFLIEGPDGAYQLTPYDPAFEKKMAAAEDIIGHYRNTLHTLAK